MTTQIFDLVVLYKTAQIVSTIAVASTSKEFYLHFDGTSVLLTLPCLRVLERFEVDESEESFTNPYNSSIF